MTLNLKKTTKLTKSGVKNSLKESSVKTVMVKKTKVRKYNKIFKKKNSGKKVKVKKQLKKRTTFIEGGSLILKAVRKPDYVL